MGQHPQWRHYRLDSMFGSMPSFLKGYIWLFTYVHISYVDIEYRIYYSIIKYNTVVHLFFAVEASYNSSFPRASNSQETTRSSAVLHGATSAASSNGGIHRSPQAAKIETPTTTGVKPLRCDKGRRINRDHVMSLRWEVETQERWIMTESDLQTMLTLW
jgi:hypothetical protein